MRERLSIALVLCFTLTLIPAFSQQIVTTVNPTQGVQIAFPPIATTGNTGWIEISQYPVSNHLLTVTPMGPTTATALTVTFDCSNDGSTVRQSLGSLSNPTGGRIYASAAQCTHIKASVTANTGTTGVKLVYVGTSSAPQSVNISAAGDVPGAAVNVKTDGINAISVVPRVGLPLDPCNAVRLTNCAK